MYRRIITALALIGAIGTGGVAWSQIGHSQAQKLALSSHRQKVTFATDPAVFGGGDKEMDNLYTLNNFICTDGIATNVAFQLLGDINNTGHQGHSLQIGNVQDYTTPTNNSPAQVSLREGSYPYVLFTSPDNGAGHGTPATDSNSLWTGQTAKVHFQSPEPVGEEIVMTLQRLDHGFVLNEDDDNRNISGATVDPTSNGDDSRPNLYQGWLGTDDRDASVTGFNTPPQTPNIDGDWFIAADGTGSTDGSSFDDVLRTDQSPSGTVTASDPNSDPSYTVQPNPATSMVQDCVIDETAPTTSAAIVPPATDSTGWYKGSVTVTLTPHKVYYASNGVTVHYQIDNGTWQTSQLTSVGSSLTLTLSTDGQHTVSYYSSDSAGLSGTPQTTRSIPIDNTPPTVSFDAGTCPSAPVILGTSLPPATWTASDATSGLATPATGSVSLSTSTVGPHSVSSGTPPVDKAGNTGTAATCTYTVIYNWKGFFQPVDNPGVVNTANAGRTIPVKFSLTGNQGLNIFAPGYPLLRTTSCSAISSNPTSAIDQAVTAGTSTLTYDASADQYTYAWQTQSSWAGTCGVFTATLNDGTTHTAYFSFK